MGTVVRAREVPVRQLSGTARTRDPGLICAGLRTIAAGGIGWTSLLMSLLATYSTKTSELLEAGFMNGLENQ
ncbi:MAG TPA: hypothetical protein DGG94_20220 [Micromonosporaceae bacterium]|nr:hypothetical protein [Micromonosporaceae bacterium]HCU52091.1 hypothetical protein [Micromonosporaceae bacterium]